MFNIEKLSNFQFLSNEILYMCMYIWKGKESSHHLFNTYYVWGRENIGITKLFFATPSDKSICVHLQYKLCSTFVDARKNETKEWKIH